MVQNWDVQTFDYKKLEQFNLKIVRQASLITSPSRRHQRRRQKVRRKRMNASGKRINPFPVQLNSCEELSTPVSVNMYAVP